MGGGHCESEHAGRQEGLGRSSEEPFRAWVQTRRDVVLTLLHRARERGEVRADADLDLAVDQVFGVFWYRLLVGHLPLDAAAAAGHVRQLLDGLKA